VENIIKFRLHEATECKVLRKSTQVIFSHYLQLFHVKIYTDRLYARHRDHRLNAYHIDSLLIECHIATIRHQHIGTILGGLIPLNLHWDIQSLGVSQRIGCYGGYPHIKRIGHEMPIDMEQHIHIAQAGVVTLVFILNDSLLLPFNVIDIGISHHIVGHTATCQAERYGQNHNTPAHYRI
jgi:hypothetical protein